MAALSHAKAWLPELDPTDIAIGYRSLKEDGTSFEQEDFAACVKVIRHVATLIADEADLTKYQLGYDAENQRIPAPHYKVTSLIPPIRKHTFAPEVDLAGLIDDEAEFEALNGMTGHHQPSRTGNKMEERKGMIRKLQVNNTIDPSGGSYLRFAKKQCFIIWTRGVM